ncbi:hypothetical protein E0E50_06135 [Azotobacter chroococcum subsp. isscasi]|uniref:hypothetical protein n=1 Tax=Azotobacter chroococcum TaxID=353 RepID=UPI00103E2068|nr:hypothetical protein [Azotobacter chroococcum]TBW11746.1 hypothetical protein E0E50_06135 [Azotobacter chroococcum subsp. isscasi]
MRAINAGPYGYIGGLQDTGCRTVPHNVLKVSGLSAREDKAQMRNRLLSFWLMIGKERFFVFAQPWSMENRLFGKSIFSNSGRQLPPAQQGNCLICRQFFGNREERNATMPLRHRLVTRFDWTALLALFTFQPLPKRSAYRPRFGTGIPFAIHA